MAVEQIHIEDFLKLSRDSPVLDVRSPAEYLHAHIPGALPLPIFSDEQRKIIGTAYKQQSRQVAVQKGLDFFSERMKLIPHEVEEIINRGQNEGRNTAFLKTNRVLVHCWRGGMRSGAVAWLLDLYGFKVHTLKGGYKAFRNWALAQFEKEYKLNVLGGYTGSGKTRMLQELKRTGHNVIDLEGLANHKGSAFGALGEKPQPGQEMFENQLAMELYKASQAEKNNKTNAEPYTQIASPGIWIEDESLHIGTAGIPKPLWKQMRKSPLYFLEIPFEERLHHIVTIYGVFKKKDLVSSIMNIQKRLGGLETKNAVNFLLENKTQECFTILLHYYDKLYTKSLGNRENIEGLLNKIPCDGVDINNAQKILSQRPV